MNINKITQLSLIAVLVFAVSFSVMKFSKADNCDISLLTGSIVSTGESGGGALATVTNGSDCSFDVGLASYKMPNLSPDPRSAQQLFDSAAISIGPHESLELHINVPDCHYQLDLFSGPVQTVPNYDSVALDHAFARDNLCVATTFVNLNFIVKDVCTGNPISGALVSINQDFGNGTTRTTDGGGFSNFGVLSNNTIGWSVSASGFNSSSGNVSSGTTDQNVNVTLNRTCAAPATPTPTPVPPAPPAAPSAPAAPTPTPSSPTPTPSVTPTPSPTPTPTPSPTPAPTPTPSPTPTPTSTPTGCTSNCGGGGAGGGLYLVITKNVRDITTNSALVKSVNANVGDTVEFTITVTPNGSNFAFNTHVGDSLPYGLSYIPSSATLNGGFLPDGIVNTGLNVGTIYPSLVDTITFRAIVQNQSNPNTTLINIATAYADNTPAVTDSAQVIIGTPIPTGTQSLTISKSGLDVTRGDTVRQTLFTARAGDTVEYDMIVSAPANATLTNVIVSDPLPLGVTYSPNTTSVNNTIVADGIITPSGINIGTIPAGQSDTIRMFATMNLNDTDGQTFTNIANSHADNVSLTNSNPVTITISNGSLVAALHVHTGMPFGTPEVFAGLGSLLISSLYIVRRKGFSLARLT